MTDHFRDIYNHKTMQYDQMVAREDYENHLFSALDGIHRLRNSTVVEFGAGTGRLTRLLAPHVSKIYAFDISPAMLATATPTLTQWHNWTLSAGDNRHMPIKRDLGDIAIAGWSFGHATGWYPEGWHEDIGLALNEMRRVVHPGGTLIIIETMGTGQETPVPPSPGLAAYYDWLESEHGFNSTWIRTDYRFESVQEAEALTRFFFGDALADRIVREQLTILPECTGIWWRTI